LPRNSIFTVFAATNQEQAGGGFFWQAHRQVVASGEYLTLWVDGGRGQDAQLRLVYKFTRRSSVGLNGRLLFIPVNGYTDLRGYVLHKLLPNVQLSADLDWTLLNRPINGQRDSVTGSANISYLIGSGWTAMLSGSVGTTPLFVTRYELTARVTYAFAHGRGGRE
jgi:hypothetical protein